MKIAALFVQENGCYQESPIIEPWGKSKDARKYDGPYPVVAHPPCQLWGSLSFVNYKRWGGDHNKPGNDGGCFKSALDSVRKYGGVLEHPAKTFAFKEYGLPKPKHIGWQKTICGGWVCEVWQSAYGHKANKATWLYYFGSNPPFELNWERKRGDFQVGHPDKRGKAKNKPTLSKFEANATPKPFQEVLILLAQNANKKQ